MLRPLWRTYEMTCPLSDTLLLDLYQWSAVFRRGGLFQCNRGDKSVVKSCINTWECHEAMPDSFPKGLIYILTWNVGWLSKWGDQKTDHMQTTHPEQTTMNCFSRDNANVRNRRFWLTSTNLLCDVINDHETDSHAKLNSNTSTCQDRSLCTNTSNDCVATWSCDVSESRKS